MYASLLPEQFQTNRLGKEEIRKASIHLLSTEGGTWYLS